MAKKRSYDVNTIRSQYEETLEQQDKREGHEEAVKQEPIASVIDEAPAPVIDPEPAPMPAPTPSPLTETLIKPQYEEDYVNPDQEEYKRMSLFMDWETWERIQALCWNENEAVNKIVVDKLREWILELPEETLENYREASKQKHLDEWAQQRDLLQYWWQISGIRDQLNIKSFKMNKNSLTVVENTGTVRNYYIHRGWVTDGQNKLAKEKLLQAQLKRMR